MTNSCNPYISSEDLLAECTDKGGTMSAGVRGNYQCSFPDGSVIACGSDPAYRACTYFPPPPPPPKPGAGNVVSPPDANAPDTPTPAGQLPTKPGTLG